MPTIEEGFEHAIEAIRAMTERSCWQCGGSKQYDSFDPGEPSALLHRVTVRCDECDDDGFIRSDRLSPEVLTGVFCMTVSEAVHAREEGNFDQMNRILDCAHRLVGERLAFEVASATAEELNDTVARAREAVDRPMKPAMTMRAVEPMTPEEIEQLHSED